MLIVFQVQELLHVQVRLTIPPIVLKTRVFYEGAAEGATRGKLGGTGVYLDESMGFLTNQLSTQLCR